MHKKKKAGLSGKEAADDVPSWAKAERPLTTENGRDFAGRLLDDKYGMDSQINKCRDFVSRTRERRRIDRR